MQSAVLFVGHGSRDPEGTREFVRLVDLFRAREPERIVEYGFLEFARPVVGDAADRCVERGARTIAVLPGMLLAAGHAKNDIPSEVQEIRNRHAGVGFHYGRHLHLHANVIELCRLRIEEAEGAARQADVSKLARLLGEGMGFGWGAACYVGVTTPLLPEALERCRRLGFRRIVVLPFFLFTGVLMKRIRRQTEECGRKYPEIEFLGAGHLGAHPLLAEAFAERAEEAIHGSPNMNCDLCKYRVRLPGAGAAVGQPQAGRHHHVRGVGQDDDDHEHRVTIIRATDVRTIIRDRFGRPLRTGEAP